MPLTKFIRDTTATESLDKRIQAQKLTLFLEIQNITLSNNRRQPYQPNRELIEWLVEKKPLRIYSCETAKQEGHKDRKNF
jgi:hypothetical protein